MSSITGRRQDTESFIQITSFDTPSRILRYNYAEHNMSVFRETRYARAPSPCEPLTCANPQRGRL